MINEKQKEKITEDIRCGCGNKMINLGNIDARIYLSYPLQWDDTYVCHKCKCKKIIRVYGERLPDYSYLDNYKEIKDE